jgi:cell division protein ZapA (FtsZ GTPase activity inhibitor)
MNAKTVNERVAELRQRRQELGLTRLELYVHPEDHEAIKALAEKLQRRRTRAIQAQRSRT